MSMSFSALPTFDPESGDVLAVIETPKGSRNKYGYNEKLGVFELRKVLPRGMIFPYDFGFIPSTEGDDGDPIDVLLLLDEPAPMGCVIRVRVIGAIEAEQREKGGDWIRNDRLLAVATHAQLHGNVESLKELNPRILKEMEAFFHQYNRMQDKDFRTVDHCGPKGALKLIEKGGGRPSASSSRVAAGGGLRQSKRP
jgi:inorganic pyrophosphatase